MTMEPSPNLRVIRRVYEHGDQVAIRSVEGDFTYADLLGASGRV